MLVQVYGDNAMKKTAVYKWLKRFSEGRESATDEERSGRPATSRTEENIAKICQIVRQLGLAGQYHAQSASSTRRSLGSPCAECCVDLGAGLDRCARYHPHRSSNAEPSSS
jgi:hypothetical protein